jgi:hypothetical protein
MDIGGDIIASFGGKRSKFEGIEKPAHKLERAFLILFMEAD